MAGSPEERTALEACRSSNASSSSSSSSSDGDEPAGTTAEAVGEQDGGAPPEEPTVDVTSSGNANAQEQRHQHKGSNEEAGKPSLVGDLMSMLMVAGGVAVAIAAAFLVNKKR